MDSWPSISELALRVKTKQTTAVELVNSSLARIKKHEEYNAVILSLNEQAIDNAKTIDTRIQNGDDVGPLAGVPFIVKDNFLVKGTETTAASNILKGFIAPYQATAITRLESAGAICVAKTNLDAFAHGTSTENSDFGATLNPYDKNRVPGGSSGGSAAAVALGMAPFALGTDTGGSIRQPSAFCGVFGLKPTYGLVSRSGVVAMGSSLDCIGPITNSSDDAASILDVISGPDELDATTIRRSATPYTAEKIDPKTIKIGVITEYMSDQIDPEIKKAVENKVDQLKRSGSKIEKISLPSLPLSLACYYIICPAEVSSNLSRYDGQKYGYSAKGAENLEESYVLSRGQGFGKEAKRRIMIGTYVLSSGYYDAYYKKAQTVRTKINNEFNEAFKKVDFLVGPVTPTTAFEIGQNSNSPLDMYLADVMTVAANLAGIPAASVPIGFSANSHKLPIGMQIMASQSMDQSLLNLAKTIEELN